MEIHRSTPSLNENQEEAVRDSNQSLLILAGAGTGKTRVVTEKIIHLLSQGVSGAGIIAFTFTNKASQEMKKRMWGRINPRNHPSFVGTFHSFGATLLRTHGSAVDVPESFTIADTGDTHTILRRILKEYELDTRATSYLRSTISFFKRKGYTPEKFTERIVRPFPTDIFKELWSAYESNNKKNAVLDFDDLILRSIHLLGGTPIGKELCDRYSHVLVDEFQDTDVQQHILINLLRGEKGNLYAVGDIDQTIYTWRGADMSVALNFEKHFSPARVIPLEINYRSTKNILTTANTLIQNNKKRRERRLVTENTKGRNVSFIYLPNEIDEAEYVVNTIKEAQREGTPYGAHAVLYRMNFQARAIEAACIKHEVPYHVIGTKFFERMEIKDACAYLRLIFLGDRDGDIARVINTPRRGIGKQTQAAHLNGRPLTKHQEKAVGVFTSCMEGLRKFSATHTLYETLEECLRRIHYSEYLKKTYEDGEERMQNIRELLSFTKEWSQLRDDTKGDVTAFFDSIALQSEQDTYDEKSDMVSLMTIHTAKGLEFENVFITGLEEGTLPCGGEEEGCDIEEERRLLYVAITRASKNLTLLAARKRFRYAGGRNDMMVSRFIDELGESIESYVSSPKTRVIEW